jgi:hypothetical protein
MLKKKEKEKTAGVILLNPLGNLLYLYIFFFCVYLFIVEMASVVDTRLWAQTSSKVYSINKSDWLYNSQ